MMPTQRPQMSPLQGLRQAAPERPQRPPMHPQMIGSIPDMAGREMAQSYGGNAYGPGGMTKTRPKMPPQSPGGHKKPFHGGPIWMDPPQGQQLPGAPPQPLSPINTNFVVGGPANPLNGEGSYMGGQAPKPGQGEISLGGAYPDIQYNGPGSPVPDIEELRRRQQANNPAMTGLQLAYRG